jgi:ubiquinone/menaquinone biosynthesis C-methylase UbiE
MPSAVAFSGTVPAYYDRYLGPFLFEPYAKDLVKRLEHCKLDKVLEIACGTGRVTRHLVSLIPEKGTLIATDLNPDMEALAHEKIISNKVQWRIVDAQSLPFENETFDAVVCQYGVMFFPDKLKAFTEAYRVLKKQGLYLFNTWGSIDANPPVAVIDNVLKEEFGNEAPDFFQKGPFSFYDHTQIQTLLEQAGFSKIKLEVVKLNGKYTDAEDIVKGFIDGSPVIAYLNEKDPGCLPGIREKIKQELVNSFGEQTDRAPLEAIVIQAEK